MVSEDDNGVVIQGARMLATIGPIADELLVFPSTVLKGTPEDAPYSFAFAINCDAPGLRFICRENLDYGRDHPLGGRFDEIDAVVVFDGVHVPWERVFMLGNPELCNGFYTETSAVVHMTHQVAARTTAKAEAFLGLVSLMTEAIGIEQFSHIQEDLAEVIAIVGILHGLGRAAEADAAPNEFGVFTPAWEPLNTARNWFPKISQRLPEIVRKFGASGLMATPTEADIVGSAAAGHRALPAIGRAERARARAALPTGMGPVCLVVRRPTEPVRVLLLRRSGPHGGCVPEGNRPRAVQGAVALISRPGHGKRTGCGMTALVSRSLRSCLGRFATGVVVVTFDGPSGRRGVTVNSFTAVSMDPPLVLVSVARRARSHDTLKGRRFCVNVLGAEQEAIARQFAGTGEGTAVWVDGAPVPRLAGVLAHLECRPWRDYDGGDHTLFLGEVVDFEYRDGPALGFHTSGFTAIADPQLGIEDLF